MNRAVWDKAYEVKHKEERAARHRVYYAEHKEEQVARSKEYRTKHREEIRARQRAYYAEHKEEKTAHRKEYRAKHKPNAFMNWTIRLRKSYGIDHLVWFKMFIDQGFTCAICKGPFASLKDQHTDHAHDTGKVRGVLCGGCNMGIGKLGEPNLVSAIKYLFPAVKVTVEHPMTGYPVEPFEYSEVVLLRVYPNKMDCALKV